MTASLLNEIRRLEAKGGWKTGLFRHGLALIAFEAFTGVFLWLSGELDRLGWTFLAAHFFLGLPLFVSVIMLTTRARLYMRVWPRRSYVISGWVAIGGLSVSYVSGLTFLATPVASKGVVWWIHVAGSVLGIGALALFLWQTLRLIALPLSEGAKAAFNSVCTKISIQVGLTSAALIGGVTALSWWEKSPVIRVPGYSRTLAKGNPFFPAHLNTKDLVFFRPELMTRSKSCGGSGCHEGIVRQWEQSAHYRTPNPFFAAAARNLIDEGDKENLFAAPSDRHAQQLNRARAGREVYRFCAGCHAPTALASGTLNGSTSELGDFEKFEGNSCILCHRLGRSGKAAGGIFQVLAPPQIPFFENQDGFGRQIHEMLMRTKPEGHGTIFMKPEYRRSNYCATCHQRLQTPSWAAGPYNDPSKPQRMKTCQACHMPQMRVADEVSSRTKGTVADHRFLSAGFTLADFYGQKNQFEATRDFLRDRKLALRIRVEEEIHRNRAIKIIVHVGNVGVGHHFPAGPELDLVESWTEITVRDEGGAVVASYGQLDSRGFLNEKATRIYRALPYDSSMRPLELDRHRSWRYAKDALFVIEPRTYDEFMVPMNPTWGRNRSMTINARLRYRKPNQRFADWVFGNGKYRVPIVDIAEATLTVSPGARVPLGTSTLDDANFEGLKKVVVHTRNQHHLSVHGRILKHAAERSSRATDLSSDEGGE